MRLFTAPWWAETGKRVLYTILATLLPLAAQIPIGQVSVADAASLAGLAGIAAFLTACASLPDPESLPLWKAVCYRALRTLGQTVGSGIVGYVLLQDVPWSTVAITAAGAVLTTLIRTLLDALPEAVPDIDGKG